MKFGASHLAYCTNIHSAETWGETAIMLDAEVLKVRDHLVNKDTLDAQSPFAIGLRLSAIAAAELVSGNHLTNFRDWLARNRCYVVSINGFPYGNFHGSRVKEQVFLPDWTSVERVRYTQQLFQILAAISDQSSSASVSTVPGSLKAFHADSSLIYQNLTECANWLDALSASTGRDFHLGLEPEPLGHIENTEETLRFFQDLHAYASNSNAVSRRIGINFDCCHFALQYESAREALLAMQAAGIRISKIHLSNALRVDLKMADALESIRPFDEPRYFHQVITRNEHGQLTRYADLPDFLNASQHALSHEARVHFHIPLDAQPNAPLGSTDATVRETLAWRAAHPHACDHYEIETYTWDVLPPSLQRPITQQIASEYAWVFANA